MDDETTNSNVIGEMFVDSEGKGGYDRDPDIVDEMREHYLQEEANKEMAEVNERRENLHKVKVRREADDKAKLQVLRDKLKTQNKTAISKFTQDTE